MERKAFTFLRSFFEAACELKEKSLQADFFMAICNYALNGEEPECTGEVKALFILIKPVLDVSQIRAECGAIGGRKNKGKTRNKFKAEQNETEANEEQEEATESNLEGIYEYEYEYENDTKENSSKKSPFDTFWDEYPNRKGKGKAREAFKKAIKKTNLETMLSAIQKQKHGSQWTRDEGKYIPYPATWLNQERWEDEVEVDGGHRDGNATGEGFPPGMDDPTMRRLWEEEQRTAL